MEKKATDEKGQLTFDSDLYHGKYYVKEEVRKPGYLPNEEIWEMDASYTDQNLAEIKLTKEVENQPTESQFTKTDATTGEELEGAKLQIIDKEGNIVEEWISAKEPHVVYGLPEGTYILHEELPPYVEGYVSAEDIEFEVKEDGSVTKVEMKDDYSKVEISKTDITTGEELEGAKLQILNKEGEILEEWVTDGKPHPAEKLPVMITKKTFAGKTVSAIRNEKFMHGVSIRNIKRAGIDIPVMAQTIVDAGDVVEIVGTKQEVEAAARRLGYIDRPTNQTDMIFVGLGILAGGLFGALSVHIGGVPISLSTSGGALIAGLVFGWLRSKHPTFGRIPEPSQWVLNNVGLNMFIAVVGISAGPSFVQGFHDVGVSLFLIGAIATTLPLIIGLLLARYLFKFHPAIALGCCAGARTTTAALGAIQDAVESETPALGYTVTYAVGNTLLIIWGVVIVLLI